MDESLKITTLISEAVAAGITAQALASYLQIPGIVLLLLFGILLGPDGLGVLHPALLKDGLESIVSLATALILFEGGLNMSLLELREVSTSLRNLLTLGVLVTVVLGCLAAHWICGFSWPIAALYASLITVISPIVNQIGVSEHLDALLEGEALFLEPLGAILAILTLNVVISGKVELLNIWEGLLFRVGIGIVIGIIGSGLLGLIVRQATNLSYELKTLVVLAGVWGAFSCAQTLDSESGLLTVAIMGISLRAAALPEEALLLQFNQQLSTLSNSILFILLAADLSMSGIFSLGWQGIATVLTLMFAIRPISVWISTWNQALSWQEKLFIAWIAPRGIAAISVASIFALSLTRHNMQGGEAFKGLVFMTVALTVVCQGLSAHWVAERLSLQSTQIAEDDSASFSSVMSSADDHAATAFLSCFDHSNSSE